MSYHMFVGTSFQVSVLGVNQRLALVETRSVKLNLVSLSFRFSKAMSFYFRQAAPVVGLEAISPGSFSMRGAAPT